MGRDDARMLGSKGVTGSMDWQDAAPALAYMAAGGTFFTIAFAIFIVFERRAIRAALVFAAIVLTGCYVSLALFVLLDRPAISMLPMFAGVYGATWFGRRYWTGRGLR
jgi:hypothetical protein